MTPIRGAISFSDINEVLGRPPTEQIDFADSTVQKLLMGSKDLNSAHACAYLNTSWLNLNVHTTLCGATTTPASFKVLIDTSAVVGAFDGHNALDIGAFPASSTVTVNNYGSIQGHSGAGGSYYSSGGAGGTAINANYENVTSIINNHGSVYGGGGGGGSGGLGGTGGQGGGGYYNGLGVFEWRYESLNAPSGLSSTVAYNLSQNQTMFVWSGDIVAFIDGDITDTFTDRLQYRRGDYVETLTTGWASYYIGRALYEDFYTNGGAGGTGGVGGTGGRGQGYMQASAAGVVGSGGAPGSMPETSPGGWDAGWGGWGGTGGTGGTGGGWGHEGGAGFTGYTGDVGGAGNNGGGAGGAVGQEGAGGGSAGLYLYKSDKAVTFNNLGTVLGGVA